MPRPDTTPDAPATRRVRLPSSTRGAILFGLVMILTAAVSMGSWAFTAPIASAVVAQGSVTVASKRKRVQHLQGGIVERIAVREGDRVNAGTVLITLDEAQARARLAIVQGTYHATLAEQVRLRAERDGADKLVFPDVLTSSPEPEVRDIISGQERLFIARKTERDGQIEILNQRIAQLEQESKGKAAERISVGRQTALIKKELAGLQELFKEGLARQDRVLSLKRELARLEGLDGKLVTDEAKAQKSIGETKLEIIQISQRFRTEVIQQLRETQTRLADARERMAAAADVLKRLKVLAPVDGVVVGLNVHTVGGVIRSGDTILEIVPSADRLVIEAKVRPTDIDNLSVGQVSDVVLTAFNQRTTPRLSGQVSRVSADALRDQGTNESFYLVQIEVPKSELVKLGAQRIQPGMPVEVMIKTGERTTVDYLLQPIMESMRRALRES